jgi:hypothetical protein
VVNFTADYDKLGAQIIGFGGRPYPYEDFEIVVLSRLLHSIKRSRHLCY